MSQDSQTSIQSAAVARAVRLLEAAGARFAVEFQGEAFGNGKLEPVKSSSPRRDLVGAYDYMKLVDGLKSGGIIRIDSNPEDVQPLRAVICKALTTKFGKGNYITHTKGTTIEVLAA